MRFPRRRQPFQQQRFEPFFVLEGEGDRQRADLVLVTTEKDLARLGGDDEADELAAHARALPVTLAFEDEERFKSLLLERLAAARKTHDGRGR